MECERLAISRLWRRELTSIIDRSSESFDASWLVGMSPEDAHRMTWEAAGEWRPQPNPRLWFSAKDAVECPGSQPLVIGGYPPAKGRFDFVSSRLEPGSDGFVHLSTAFSSETPNTPDLIVELLNKELAIAGSQLR